MALLMLESFDDAFGRTAERWSQSYVPEASSGLHGWGMRLGDQNNRALIANDFSIVGDTLIVGMAIRFQSFAGSTGELEFFEWSSTTNFRCSVGWQGTTGRLIVRYQDNTTETWDVGDAFATGVWRYWEFKILLDGTVGTFECWVDGISKASATGKNTALPASVECNIAGANGPWDMDVDDIYIADGSGSDWNDVKGPLRVEPLIPNGNGNTSGLTGSDADQTDNYLQVDGIAIDEANYNGSGTEADFDLYAFPALADTADVIHGIAIDAWVQKDSAGTKFGRIKTRSNSVNYDGASEALAQSWDNQRDIREVDPNTGAAWTQTNLEAAEFGWEVRDS